MWSRCNSRGQFLTARDSVRIILNVTNPNIHNNFINSFTYPITNSTTITNNVANDTNLELLLSESCFKCTGTSLTTSITVANSMNE